jgi:putative transposase
VFTARHLPLLEEFMRDVCGSFECTLESFACPDGSTVTIEVSFPPKVALARLVNSLKGVSSRLLRKEFPELDGYCQDARLWSASYYAGTGTGTPPGAREFASRQSQASR